MDECGVPTTLIPESLRILVKRDSWAYVKRSFHMENSMRLTISKNRIEEGDDFIDFGENICCT